MTSVYLSDINNTTQAACMTVRIVRYWENCDLQNVGEPYSLDMVLLDAKDTVMHAFVKEELIALFKPLLKEGIIIKLSNFGVLHTYGEYKPIAAEYKILFLSSTTLAQMEDDFLPIPRYYFNFATQQILENALHQESILTDLIGVIVGYGQIEDIPVGERVARSRRLNIMIEGEKIILVTLWWKSVFQIDELMNGADSGPRVVVLTSLYFNIRKGELTAEATSGTCVYLNIQIPQCVQYMDRYGPLEVRLMTPLPVSKDDLHTRMFYNRKYIMEMIKMDYDSFSKQRRVTIHGRISGFEELCGWNYVPCLKCSMNTVEHMGNHLCPACNEVNHEPRRRFLIHCHVVDPTGQANLILKDKDAQKMLGTTASNLVVVNNNDATTFPAIVNSLIGKQFVFEIKDSEIPTIHGYSYYSVSKVFEPDDDLEADYLLNYPIKIEVDETDSDDDYEDFDEHQSSNSSGSDGNDGGTSGGGQSLLTDEGSSQAVKRPRRDY